MCRSFGRKALWICYSGNWRKQSLSIKQLLLTKSLFQDESHTIKNFKTKSASSAKRICEKSKRIILLSGKTTVSSLRWNSVINTCALIWQGRRLFPGHPSCTHNLNWLINRSSGHSLSIVSGIAMANKVWKNLIFDSFYFVIEIICYRLS